MPEIPNSTYPTSIKPEPVKDSQPPCNNMAEDREPPETHQVGSSGLILGQQTRANIEARSSPNPLIVNHKRQMLKLSDISFSNQSEVVTMQWEEERANWEIVKLVYSHNGIQNSGIVNSDGEAKDEFGDYPNWIYILHHTRTNITVPVGPNDVETLFSGSNEESKIESLKEEKENLQSEYAKKVENILKLKVLIEDENIIDEVKEFEKLEKISDRYFDFINDAQKAQELKWQLRFSETECSLNDFIQILDNLNKLLEHLKKPNTNLSYLTREQLTSKLACTETGNIPSIEEVTGLIKSNGFEPKIKPFSFAASVVADRYT